MSVVVFYAGLAIGVPCGFLVASVFAAGARADEASERIAHHLREAERIDRLTPPDDVSDRDWMYSEHQRGDGRPAA